MTSDTTPSILYAIETINTPGGQREFRLYLTHRAGRGLIDDPQITILGSKDPTRRGFYMRFEGEDGQIEQIGDESKPLPMEIYLQAYSDNGLTIVNLGDSGDVISGQVLWMDDYMIVRDDSLRRPPHKDKC